VCARFIGTKGHAEIRYAGGAFIKGENEWNLMGKSTVSATNATDTFGESEWNSGGFNTLFDADINKGKSFIQSIENGKYPNQIGSACESTLTAILGREAVLKNEQVSWKKLVSSNQCMDHKLNLSKFK